MKESIQNGVNIIKDISEFMKKMEQCQNENELNNLYIGAHKQLVESNKVISRDLGNIYSEKLKHYSVELNDKGENYDRR